MAEVGCEGFIHPSFAIAIRAYKVVPPLMTNFVADKIFCVTFCKVRHGKNAIIYHHQRSTLVTIPAKIGFDNGKFREWVWAKPKAVGNHAFTDNAQEFLGVKLMLFERLDFYFKGRFSAREFYFRFKNLESWGA